jgi:hypothetical protein
MPKQTPSTRVRMQPHPPLPAYRWIPVILTGIVTDAGVFRFTFGVPDRPDQAGRQIEHTVPAFLTSGSPLAEFLADAFDIWVAMDTEIELTDLVGRQTEAKFSKPDPHGVQQIVAWRPAPAESSPAPATPSPRPSPVPSESAVTPPNPSTTPVTPARPPATPARPAGAAGSNTGVTPDKGVTND